MPRAAIILGQRIYLPEWAAGVVCTVAGRLLACERHPVACHRCERWYSGGRTQLLQQHAPCLGDWARSWTPASDCADERRRQLGPCTQERRRNLSEKKP